jgi:hypothetical protein
LHYFYLSVKNPLPGPQALKVAAAGKGVTAGNIKIRLIPADGEHY